MADSGHHHDHEPGHGDLRHYTAPIIIFSLLGPVEMVVGLWVGNPAITSIGGHDASDALFPIVGMLVAMISGRARRRWPEARRWRTTLHALACQLPAYTGLSIGLANIIVIGLIPVLTAPASLDWNAAWAGVAVGVVSFLANWYAAGKFHGKVHVHDHGLESHFRLDMWAAVAAATSGIVSAWTGDIKWVIAAAGIILGLSLTETLPELRRNRRMLHSAVRHPAGV